MALNTSGSLLEGIRFSTGNNSFNFPLRSVITNQIDLDGVTERAEYALLADSIDKTKIDLEIADPDLQFLWTKNSTVFRFDYDNFSNRWLPAPGSSPDLIGIISNDPRLKIPAFNGSKLIEAPILLFIGETVRQLTLNIVLVSSSSLFTNPSLLAAGTVEVSEVDLELNFSATDLTTFNGQSIYHQKQNFTNRISNKGQFGSLPISEAVDYYLYLNPKPASGQIPRIRIGYGPLLTPIEVLNEALLGNPVAGTCSWSVNTGRVRFSSLDVQNNLSETVYYDGVTLGNLQFNRISVSVSSAWPSSAFVIIDAIGLTDDKKYVIFAEKLNEPRYYWTVKLKDFSLSPPSSRPPKGTVYLDTSTGAVYFDSSDISNFSTWTFYYFNTILEVETGVSVQFYRSGANGSGVAQVSDFYIVYSVDSQLLNSNIGPYPFALLPTTPIINNNLSYEIEQNSGSFVGTLENNKDSGAFGYGYLLDLEISQFNFSNRIITNIVLNQPTTSLQIGNAALSAKGLGVTVNGNPAIQGVDYTLDVNTGLLDFISPNGENDPLNILNISGSIILPDQFLADISTFSITDVGKYLYIKTGSNQGIYEIIQVLTNQKVIVSPDFSGAGVETADLLHHIEIVTNRIWKQLLPPFKNFSLSRAASNDSSFVQLENTEYSVFEYVSQVNLNKSAQPGEVFEVSYLALVTDNEGASYNTENRIEKALFKVRQETAIFIPGTTTATFNFNGNTVNTTRSLIVYLNGVILDNYTYRAPNQISVPNPLQSGQNVVIDYWIEEALGGESNFRLTSDQLELDRPSITAESNLLVVNGDLTSEITPRSAFYVSHLEVLIAETVSYNATEDTTTIIFTTNAVNDNDGSDLLVCESITNQLVDESAVADILSANTNILSLTGDRTASYTLGTIVTINDDPYAVQGANLVNGKTEITLSDNAQRNYIIPIVKYIIRPILESTKEVSTSKLVHPSFNLSLIKGGNDNNVLIKGTDYTNIDGSITLTNSLVFGDILYSLYVSREFKPTGTNLEINYAYAIAPDKKNGIENQRLLSSYDLYAPDTYFYRVETIRSFLPDINNLLKSNSQVGSGPSISDAISSANKDLGTASPYFQEQNYGNLDTVVIKILKYYNDLINKYEDLLANFDGRVVGGQSGKFRFDGNINNPERNLYEEITNDIDDRIKLYDSKKLISFYTFQNIPIYKIVGSPSVLSRLYPVVLTKSAAIGNNTAPTNVGETMGTLGIEGLKNIGKINSSKANEFFTLDIGTTISISQNGDADNLIPPFIVGQDVDIYSHDGVLNISTTITTVNPTNLILGLAPTINKGSIVQNISDPLNPLNHFYTNGVDLSINTDTGEIININYGLLNQNPPTGNEILDVPLSVIDSGTTPKRIPVFDGLELNDDGRVPAPRLKYENENDLLNEELMILNKISFTTVRSDQLTLRQPGIGLLLVPGDLIRFLNGPNNGQIRSIMAVLDDNNVTVSMVLPSSDLAGSDFQYGLDRFIENVISDTLSILNNNVEATPIPPAKIGPLNSELNTIDDIIMDFGIPLFSSSGTTTVHQLTDMSVDFSSVETGYLVYITSGDNRGLYSIIAINDPHTITIDINSPFSAFPVSAGVSYIILKPETFIDSDQFGLISDIYRETIDFTTITQNWSGSITTAGKANRIININDRLALLSTFVENTEDTLINGGLYDQRFLWVQQRTDLKDGTLSQKLVAQNQRVENIQKITEDQKKLLVTENL